MAILKNKTKNIVFADITGTCEYEQYEVHWRTNIDHLRAHEEHTVEINMMRKNGHDVLDEMLESNNYPRFLRIRKDISDVLRYEFNIIFDDPQGFTPQFTFGIVDERPTISQ